MEAFLVAVAVVFFVWLVLVTLAAGIAVWGLRRTNEVVRGQRSPTPLRWLWSPSRPARLHRELRAAATWNGAAGPQYRRDLWDELCEEAIRLDHEIAALASAPRPIRRRVIPVLSGQVSEINELSRRIQYMEGRAVGPDAAEKLIGGRVPPPDEGITELRRHVETLESAQEELVDLERVIAAIEDEEPDS